jgi:putative Holliday junction resolvase
MRTAAVDYGEKRIGLAVSDELGMLARPLGNVEGPSEAARIAAAAERLRAEGAGRVLLGLPRHMDGREGDAAPKVRAFAEGLRAALGCEVKFVDERLSTVQASRALREAGQDARRQKKTIDSASAVVILQAWLDANPQF